MKIKKTSDRTTTIKKEIGSTKNNEQSQSFYCDSEFIKSILSEIQDLKINDKFARKDIKNLTNIVVCLQVFVTILVAVIAFAIPFVAQLHAQAIDRSINAKYELILQELKNQKENNQMQIQRDVAMQVKKIK